MKIGIIDYGGGNLRSVANALRALGVDPEIVAAPGQADACSHLLLPGQGAFGDCMDRLEKRGLAELLRNWIALDRPYLGICVGYQILFDASDEAEDVRGLEVIPGIVRKFEGEPGLKIPHMGWNSAVGIRPSARVWHDLGDEPYFYYVHSYFPEPLESSVIVAETTHGTQKFAAAVERGNLFACQFHPEKSQDAGLKLIRNFISA